MPMGVPFRSRLTPSFSHVSLAAGPIYAAAGVASLATTCTANSITQNATTFRVLFKNSDKGVTLAFYLARLLGKHRADVIVSDDGYGHTLQDGFQRVAGRLGIDAQYFAFKTPDEAAQIANYQTDPTHLFHGKQNKRGNSSTTDGMEADGSNSKLFPDLFDEPPIRARRDDLVGRRLDHAELAQTQRVETDRVLEVVVAPVRIGDLPKPLPRIVVARRKASIDQIINTSGEVQLEDSHARSASHPPDVKRLANELNRDRRLGGFFLPMNRGR